MTWHTEQAAVARQAGDMMVATWDAAVERTAQRLRARRLADEKWGKPLWSADASELQAVAEDVWRAAYPDRHWPTGWRCRWATTYGIAAPDGVREAVARCDHRLRLILFDRPYFTRHPQHLREIAAHELAHVVTPGDEHGERFKSAFHHIHPAARGPVDGPLHRERRRPMRSRNTLTLAPARSRVEYRAPGGQPIGAEFLLLVQAAERELIRRSGPDAPRWVESWKARQSADGAWSAVPTLSRRKSPLTVADATARMQRRRA